MKQFYIVTILFVLLICLTMGCSSFKMREVYVALGDGRPVDAYNYIETHAKKKNSLPFLFDKGLVAHYADKFTQSNSIFLYAEDISENLYTRSISKEGMSLFINDRVRPYPGTRYERLLTHYYRILNYLFMNKLDSALVECRRATRLIQYYIDSDKDYDFFAAPFLAHLSGIVFEANGDWNDALISYKQAESYYQQSQKKTGMKMPDDVGHSIIRMARILGFTDDIQRYQQRYGILPTKKQDSGELILFFENGYIPLKYQKTLTFPILKSDTDSEAFKKDNDKASSDFAKLLLGRQGKSYAKSKIEYLLRVALPAIKSDRPKSKGISVHVGTTQEQGVLVADLEAMAIETLNTQHTTILLRSVTRAFLKYVVYRLTQIEKKKKEKDEAEKKKEANRKLIKDLAGLVVQTAAFVTEQADTRQWNTLPNQIFMVRMPLPSGIHNVNLTFLNSKGQNSISHNIENVEINSSEFTFLNYRTYK